jgi:thiol:disulfide interchange protein DsbA
MKLRGIMMRMFRLLFSIVSLFAVVVVAHAITPIDGENYLTLDPAHATEPGKKVEVIEFFAYYCPHCNALDLPLANWVKAQGDNIVFKRVHTTNSGDNEPMPQQRLFYALEAMGKEDEFHQKIMFAIHFQKQRLSSDEDIIDFMVKLGVDRQKFIDVYHSFTVRSKVTNAIQMQASYQIDNWPTIVIDGRFATSPPIAGSHMDTYDEPVAQDLMLSVMEGLVAKLHKERNRSELPSATK